ncbi:signal peptide peptidase SppA [Candidatus Woesearchaeota archaeon]|nr:MAG: signal peptide peptidase SppA [Candidatus Woesearchaeota archaeon]
MFGRRKTRWKTMLLIVLIIWAVSAVIASFFSTETGNVSQIPITGVIRANSETGYFKEKVTSSDEVVELIEKADKNPLIKAIILEINSPGGSAVASDEIARAVKDAEKPVVAWIRESGASGAYWVASSSDYIVANRMSITGSIGVISSYLEFSGLLQDYNVSYQRLVAGEHKDIGSPFRKLSDEEKEIFQEYLDKVHEFFIESVKENRNLSDEQVKKIRDGRFFLGAEAKELGLVDELGGKKEVIRYIESRINETAVIKKHEKKKSFFEMILESSSPKTTFFGKDLISRDNSLIIT